MRVNVIGSAIGVMLFSSIILVVNHAKNLEKKSHE